MIIILPWQTHFTYDSDKFHKFVFDTYGYVPLVRKHQTI